LVHAPVNLSEWANGHWELDHFMLY
jgi:hypothetical protein